MNIYQVDLKPLETQYKQSVINALPSLAITVGSSIKLNEICIMMLVKEAMSKVLDDAEGVSIYMTENQNKYNYICENDGFEDVLMLCPSIKVDAPSKWHIVANPLEVMGYLTLVSETADIHLQEDDPQIWFDIQHSAIYTQETQDFDHDSVSTGTIVYDRNTGLFELHLATDCRSLQPLFDFPETYVYLKNLVQQIFAIKGFRFQNWDFHPKQNRNPDIKLEVA